MLLDSLSNQKDVSVYLEQYGRVRVAKENETDEIFVPLELVSPGS